ncbi:MAG: hypothetical protein WBF93_22225 [Pirellulales bacterium]
MRNYFASLFAATGVGWNRWWYTKADPFNLCVLRIAVGLIALYLHVTYTWDLAYFLPTGGLLPFELTEQLATDGVLNPARLSYLSYLFTPTELYIAHTAGGVILLMFTVGWCTRVTSWLALWVTLSYVHRAPFATSEVEPILSMLQFYLCLGPCGRFLSVDNWRRRRRAAVAAQQRADVPDETVSANIAIRLIQVHTALACLMMGLGKLAGPGSLQDVIVWRDLWGTGEATWIMIARPLSPMVDLKWLEKSPYLLQAWSHAILLFEMLFGLLVWNRWLRPLMLGLAVVHWGLLSLISGVPMLSVLMIVANIAFVAPAALRHLIPSQDRDG